LKRCVSCWATTSAHLLPLGIEQLPALKAFDTVFSMGVLYHRRSPLDHLWQLKDQLVSGGELVLETLVVEGMKMPFWCRATAMRRCATSTLSLRAGAENWLEKCGFVDVRIVDVCVTSTEEQRRTDWMTTESLADFLDPQDQQQNRGRLSGSAARGDYRHQTGNAAVAGKKRR
jgi:tRNA (mo5U34)-methyltransferase